MSRSIFVGFGLLMSVNSFAVRQTEILGLVGNPIPGLSTSTITAISAPQINANGQIAFNGAATTLAGSQFFVSTPASSPVLYSGLTNRIDAFGFGTSGLTTFSAAMTGTIASQFFLGSTLRFAEGDQVPGMLAGQTLSSVSRSFVDSQNRVFAIGTFRNPGATSNSGRFLIRSAPGGSSGWTLLQATGTQIGGITLGSLSPDFAFDISLNGNQIAQSFKDGSLMTSQDDRFVVNGVILFTENSPTPVSGTWRISDNSTPFKVPVINDLGQWAFAAGLGSSLPAAIMTSNGVGPQQGEALDGFVLPTNMRYLAINNQGWLAQLWGSANNASQGIWLGGIAALNGSIAVVRAGDRLDTTGDGAADYTLNSIIGGPTNGTGVTLAENGDIAFSGTLTPVGGGAAVTALVRVPHRQADVDLSLEVDAADIDLVIGAFGSTPGTPGWIGRADCDFSGEVDAADIDIAIERFGS